MDKKTIHIPQGSSLRLLAGEASYLASVFKNKGIGIECIDFKQEIVDFPQAYVGYINMPDRKIVIDSKQEGIHLSHIIRIYYFLYASDVKDLDDPIYDIDLGSSFDVVKNFIMELHRVVKKGLPVEYKNNRDNLQFLRGNINVVNTIINQNLGRRDIFDCSFDELSHDIPVNQVLYMAFLKAKQIADESYIGILEKYFYDVSEVKNIPEVNLTTNTMYCKKALSLAHMILNDLNITVVGNQAYGQNLLLNFDRLFEEFIKRILTIYSSDYEFTYWTDEKVYASCKTETEEFTKSYIPDMLYGYQDKIFPISAYAILDMKNKASKPFSNADVYQMFFYANQLYSKKVILCYPANKKIENAHLLFDNDSFSIRKIFAVYVNIAGDTSKDFKKNIYEFIDSVKALL